MSDAKISPSEVARKLAALIAAGVGANQAWALVQTDIENLNDQQRAHINLLWSTATETGGPLGGAVARFAAVLSRLEQNHNQLRLTFASPKATSRLIFGLPFIGLGLAQLLGLNPVAAMVSSLPGFLALCLGLILMLVASIISARMLRRASPNFSDPGLVFDCVVIGLQAGLPLQSAVSNALARQTEQPAEDVLFRLKESAALSEDTGAQLTQILTAAADSLRDAVFNEQSNKIAKLAVHLMVPLGLAVLPAFVLLTVVPIAIGLLG